MSLFLFGLGLVHDIAYFYKSCCSLSDPPASTPTVLFPNLCPLPSLQLLHRSAAVWVGAVPPPRWLPCRGINTTSPPCRASPSTPSSSPGSLSSRVYLLSLPCWPRRRSRWWWLNRWWVYEARAGGRAGGGGGVRGSEHQCQETKEMKVNTKHVMWNMLLR